VRAHSLWQDYNSPSCASQEYLHPGSYYDQLIGAEDVSDWQHPGTSWPGSPFSDSQISSSASGGIYRDGTWNPFDQSFQSPVRHDSHGPGGAFVPSAYPPGFGTLNPQAVTPSYVTLSAISESKIRDTFSDEDEMSVPGFDAGSPGPTRQPAWGRTKSSPNPSASVRSSNGSLPPSKRRKSTSVTSPRSPPELAHRLRSTTTANTHRPSTSSSSLSSISSNSPASAQSKGARTNHNQVEKQYRNRLNGQFETLLQTLPREEGGYAGEKRVSKAEVLVLAKKHIMRLERERRALEEENRGLEGSVAELKRRWVGLGGICMP
jgi:hypothetical protein